MKRNVGQRVVLAAVSCCGVVLSGCGLSTAAMLDLPTRLVGSGGQRFLLEDLQAIARDTDLTIEERRQAFRDLGIEDEVLIDALLEL